MKRKIILPLLLVMGILVSSGGYAITVSTTGAFTSFSVVTPTGTQLININSIVQNYTSQYTQVIDPAFSSMASSYSVSNAAQPIFGKPNHWIAFGFNAGFGFSGLKFDEKKAGGKELNGMMIDAPLLGEINPLTIGMAIAPYATISLGWIDSFFGVEFFKETDITLKYLTFDSKKYTGEKFNAKLSNFSLLFRKQFLSDTTLIPVLLSFSGLSWNMGFNTSSIDARVKVPVNQNAKVVLGQQNIGGTDYNQQVDFNTQDAIINYNVKTVSFDTEMKGYVNILYLFDLYLGGGLTWNAQSKVGVNGSIDGVINAGIDADSDGTIYVNPLNAFDAANEGQRGIGGIRIDGEGQGQKLIPRLMMGTQINIFVVKLGAQYTVAYTKNAATKNVTFGLSLAF